jgi:hypothetical protein
VRSNASAHAERQRRRGGQFEFLAVAHARTEQIRQWRVDTCDVIYDPRLRPSKNDFDLAHANLTLATKSPEAILSTISEILPRLELTKAEELAGLPTATCAPPWSYRILKWFFRDS